MTKGFDFNKYIDEIASGIFIYQGERVIFANREALAISGYSLEEALGMNFWDFVHPDMRETVKEQGLKRQRDHSNMPARYEVPILTKDGKTKWIDYAATIIEHKGTRAVLGSIKDITARKAAEEELRESEERYRSLVQTAKDAIFTVNGEGIIVSWNHGAEVVYGYTQKEAIGQNVTLMMPERFRGHHQKSFFQHATTSGRGIPTIPVEGLGLHKDGSEFPLEKTFNMFKTRDGAYVTGIMRDITERKRLEAQLQQAQKMEAIGTLAGGIAHDFNNILSAIIGYTEMSIYDLPEDSQIRPNLEQVLKSSKRARDLVRQILMFSRKGDQKRQPVLISHVAREVCKLIRASIPTTIEIIENLDDNAGVIMADPTQFHQLIMNLCTNAADAMPDQKGTIEISLGTTNLEKALHALPAFRHLKPGPYINLTVRDSGTGISPDNLSRIFDPFFTTKEIGRGTGMGLAVVHGIVKGHDGALHVESTPNRGSTFQILIPQVNMPAQSEEEPLQDVPRGTETILIVDDEKILTDIFKQMLESLGYTVTAKTDGDEALALFQSSPDRFDLVITDQTMPHMTGYELSKKLMAIRSDILVVLCSGYSDAISMDEIKSVGIKDFFMKPYDRGKIAHIVRRVLDRQAEA